MTLPQTVRFGIHDITIRTDADTAARLREEGSSGDARADALVIRIDPDKPATVLADVLLHELLHVVWNHTSLRSSEQCVEVEEAVVSAITPGLLQVLHDNPDVVELLTGGR